MAAPAYCRRIRRLAGLRALSAAPAGAVEVSSARRLEPGPVGRAPRAHPDLLAPAAFARLSANVANLTVRGRPGAVLVAEAASSSTPCGLHSALGPGLIAAGLRTADRRTACLRARVPALAMRRWPERCAASPAPRRGCFDAFRIPVRYRGREAVEPTSYPSLQRSRAHRGLRARAAGVRSRRRAGGRRSGRRRSSTTRCAGETSAGEEALA